jgi:hypothetical protein
MVLKRKIYSGICCQEKNENEVHCIQHTLYAVPSVNKVDITVGKCQSSSCAFLGMRIKLEKRYLEKSNFFQDAYEECCQIGWEPASFTGICSVRIQHV